MKDAASPKASQFVDLISDDDDDEEDGPTTDLIQTAHQADDPNASRDSLLLDAFYQKYVVGRRSPPPPSPSTSLLPERVEWTIIERPPKRVKARRTPDMEAIKPEEAALKVPGPPATTITEPARPPTKLGRPPRNKDEACSELTMYIDERLNGRLQMAPQMSESFRISVLDRLDDPALVCWKRQPWDQPGASLAYPVACLVFETATIASMLEGDLEEWLDTVRLRAGTKYTQVYLVLMGFKAHRSKMAVQVNRRFREAVLAGTRVPSSDRVALTQTNWQDMEQSLWLACSRICSSDALSPLRLVLLETPALVRSFLLEASRNVAWLPYNEHAERFSICVVGTNIGLKRSHDGPDETFRLMLLHIIRLTHPMANAIIQAYPTLACLMTAYRSRPNTQEARLLLAPIKLDNGRTVGQAVSARVYTVFTSRDPNQFIR